MENCKTITASWDGESEQSDEFLMLKMMLAMAESSAKSCFDKWRTSKQISYGLITVTEFTNGVVCIGEELEKVENTILNCFYYLGKAKKD